MTEKKFLKKKEKKAELYNMKFYVNIYESLDFLIMENLEERIKKEKMLLNIKKMMIKKRKRKNKQIKLYELYIFLPILSI